MYRAAMYIQFFFYKNFTFLLPQIYYSFLSAFSGQVIFLPTREIIFFPDYLRWMGVGRIQFHLRVPNSDLFGPHWSRLEQRDLSARANGVLRNPKRKTIYLLDVLCVVGLFHRPFFKYYIFIFILFFWLIPCSCFPCSLGSLPTHATRALRWLRRRFDFIQLCLWHHWHHGRAHSNLCNSTVRRLYTGTILLFLSTRRLTDSLGIGRGWSMRVYGSALR